MLFHRLNKGDYKADRATLLNEPAMLCGIIENLHRSPSFRFLLLHGGVK